MAVTYTWLAGAFNDYSTEADWTNSSGSGEGTTLPGAGDTIDIGTGGFFIMPSPFDPALATGLTLNFGLEQANLLVSPASYFVAIDLALPAMAIDNLSPGGDMVSGGALPVIGAGLLVEGTVTSSATINIGAGDVDYIAIGQDAAPGTPDYGQPGYFDNNHGTINATGSGANHAGLAFLPGSSPLIGTGATATYGNISLSDAYLDAAVPDVGTGNISMANGSRIVANADLQHTNVAFGDANETLAIGQNVTGTVGGTGTSAEYAFGGTISGFQSGDTIGLMENGTGATPASLSFASTGTSGADATGVLTIKDASNDVLGALNLTVPTAQLTTDQFVLTQQPTGPDWPGYTSQYNISLADVATASLASPGDIDAASTYATTPNPIGTAPTSGGVVDIGTGKVTISGHAADDNTLLPSTIIMGANPSGGSSNSDLAITDYSVGANVTIDATDLGGTFNSNQEATAMFGAIGSNGAVSFAGAINVGAGDGFSISVAGDPAPSTAEGYFDDTGVINVEGTSSNYAYMQTKQGNAGGNPSTGAFVALGTVNLSYGFFIARAPDSGTSSTANGGTFNLSNSSILGVVNTVLGTTVVNFEDATGDSLAIGEVDGQANGQYFSFGGAINGFQQGDTIGLMTNSSSPSLATPSYVQWNATTNELEIFNSGGTQIGQVHLVGNYVQADFTAPTKLTGPAASFATAQGYASEYLISYNDPHLWVSGATGDFNTASDWAGGVVPPMDATATLQQGTIQIGPFDGIPSPLTLDVGTSVAYAGASSQSNLQVIYNSLSSGVTINNTSGGGSSVSPTVLAPIVESQIQAVGTVESQATINVGAGDMEIISPTSFAPGSTPGVFDNLGDINLDGTVTNGAVSNFADLFVAGGAGATVDYGTVNASGGAIFADVADAPATSLAAADAPGAFFLSNGSDAVAMAALSDTNVTFVDGTDTLAIGAQSGAATANTYQFGGTIYGLQQGDVVSFQTLANSPTPKSVAVTGYGTDANGMTTILTVYDGSDGSGDALGSISIEGKYTTIDFTGAYTSATELSPFGYTGGYNFGLNTNAAPADQWKNGATADFATSGDWSSGVPTTGVATIGNGTVDVGASDALSSLSLHMGSIVTGTQGSGPPKATSMLVVTGGAGETLAADIMNFAGGGSFNANQNNSVSNNLKSCGTAGERNGHLHGLHGDRRRRRRHHHGVPGVLNIVHIRRIRERRPDLPRGRRRQQRRGRGHGRSEYDRRERLRSLWECQPSIRPVLRRSGQFQHRRRPSRRDRNLQPERRQPIGRDRRSHQHQCQFPRRNRHAGPQRRRKQPICVRLDRRDDFGFRERRCDRTAAERQCGRADFGDL